MRHLYELPESLIGRRVGAEHETAETAKVIELIEMAFGKVRLAMRSLIRGQRLCGPWRGESELASNAIELFKRLLPLRSVGLQLLAIDNQGVSISPLWGLIEK